MRTIIRSFYLSLLTAEKAARYEVLNKSLGVRRQSHEEATKQQPPGTILTAPPLALSRPTSGEGCLIGATPIAPTAAKTWKTPASASAATQGAAAENFLPCVCPPIAAACTVVVRGSLPPMPTDEQSEARCGNEPSHEGKSIAAAGINFPATSHAGRLAHFPVHKSSPHPALLEPAGSF